MRCNSKLKVILVSVGEVSGIKFSVCTFWANWFGRFVQTHKGQATDGQRVPTLFALE